MSNQSNAPKPNALYRYHPEYGYVEVMETEQNPNPQFIPQQTNVFPQGTNFPPYCPPFMPHYAQHMMHYNYMQEMQKLQNFYEEQNKNSVQKEQNTIENNEEKEGLTEEKIREIYTVVNDAVNGNPDPQKMFSLFKNTPNDFWKGLAIGAGAVLLFNYSPLKNMLASMLAEAEQTQENDFCEECVNTESNNN